MYNFIHEHKDNLTTTIVIIVVYCFMGCFKKSPKSAIKTKLCF